VSKPSSRNENPLPHDQKSSDRAAPQSPPRAQSETQTLADPLSPYRAALGEVKSLAAEITKLSASRAELGTELEELRAQAARCTDELVADPTERISLEPELETCSRREVLAGHQIGALEQTFLGGC
jgi:chromosome segregation ATPase